MTRSLRVRLGLIPLVVAVLVAACGGPFGAIPDLTVTGVTPSSGPIEGGVDIVITGTGFYQAADGGSAHPLDILVCGSPLRNVSVQGEVRRTLLPGGANSAIVVGGSVTGTTTAGADAANDDIVVLRADGERLVFPDAFECYLPAPVIEAFAASATAVTTNQNVTFTWSVSSPSGEALACTVDPADGTAPYVVEDCGQAGNRSVDHAFATPGRYVVSLDVRDASGDAASASVTVDASNAAPTASFTATPETGFAPLAVALDATTSTDPDGVIAAWAWDFGDGATGMGATASHSYTSPGTYTVALTVTDDGGATATASREISVLQGEAPAITSFAATPDTIDLGESTSLAWSVDGTEPLTLSLAPGSGDVTGSSETIVTPTAATTYTLTATNAFGTDSAVVTVTVRKAPTATADGPYALGVGGTLAVTSADSSHLLANDDLGFPEATITSFGGGDAGGAVTDHAVDASVAFAGGTLTVGADGSFTVTAPAAAGTYTFEYRLANALGAGDGVATISVQDAPLAQADAMTVLETDALASDVTADNGAGTDYLGTPAGSVASFGGGDLGGSVTDNTAGTSTALAGGTLTLTADGNLTLTASGGNLTTGTHTLQYRLENTAGTSDATITIDVWSLPQPTNDELTTTTNTTLSANVTTDNGHGPDHLGVPTGNVTSFGAGDLGGTVTDNTAGTSTALAGGTLTLNADGALTLINPTTPGTYTLQYRLTNTAGTNDATITIDVYLAPTAADDGPAAASAPGDPYHTSMDATLNMAAPGLLGNDALGHPAATLTSFGGGGLGGGVTDHAAGATASFGTVGSLTVGSDGSLSFTPDTGFTGLFTFSYRLTNLSGTSDGTVSIAVGARPAATDDSYPATVIGNTPVDTSISTTFTVLGNDHGDDLGFAAMSVTSTNGGSATIDADGTFTYSPAAGYTGTDTFDYTIENGLGTDVGTVTVAVAETVWYIDRNATPGGDGTLTSRFDNMQSFETAGVDGANHTIFVYEGNYPCGFTLKNGQQLLGHNNAEGLAAMSGLTFPADSLLPPSTAGAPVQFMLNTGIDCITLGQDNTLRRFTVGDTGAGIGIVGSGFGTLTATDLTVTGTGGALSLANGSLAAGFAGITSTSGTHNVFLSGVGGSLTVLAGDLSGASSSAFSLASSTAAIGMAASITNTTPAATSVSITGSGGSVAFSGPVDDTGAGIRIQDNASVAVTFSGGLDLSTGTAHGLVFQRGGTLSVTGSTNRVVTTSGTAIDLQSAAIGTSGVTFASVSSNGAASGISLNGVSGNLTVTGDGATSGSGGTIQNSTSDAIVLTNAGTVSLSHMSVVNNQGHGIHAADVLSLAVDRSDVSDNAYADSRLTSGIEVLAAGSTSGSVTITNSTLQRNRTYGLRLRTSDSAVSNLTLQGNTFIFNRARPFLVVHGSGQPSTFTIASNVTDGDSEANGASVQIDDFDLNGVSDSYQGRVQGNTFRLTPVGAHTNVVGNGLEVAIRGNGGLKIDVSGNTIDGYGTSGIELVAQEGTVSSGSAGRLDVILTNNAVTNPDPTNAMEGMYFRSGSSRGSELNRLCVNATNNDSVRGPNWSTDAFYLEQLNSTAFYLEGFTTDVQTTLASRGNTFGGGTASGSGTFTSEICAAPSF